MRIVGYGHRRICTADERGSSGGSNWVPLLVSRVESMLQGVNCDLLAEIEVPLRSAWGDFLDQAERRVPWLDQSAEAYAARIKKALKTTVKVIANLKPR